VALPLQPALDPWPPRWRRLALVLLLAGGVLALGLVAPSRRARCEPLATMPGAEPAYERRVAEAIRGARQRVWVVMFSLWAGAEGQLVPLAGELAAAAARGVKVQVCLDLEGERDGRTPEDRNAQAAAWLAARGVQVVRDEPQRRTHAKLILIDGRTTVLGSHNWTWSALRSNRELSLITDDLGIAAAASALCRSIPGWDPAW
jgi:cardiolipin synthase